MIFKRKKPERPRIADIPRFPLRELRRILDQPNGRQLLQAQRRWSVEYSKQQDVALADQLHLVEYTRALKANAEAVVRDIDKLLGQVEA